MRFLLVILAVVAPCVLGTELHDHIRIRREPQQGGGNYQSYGQAPAAIKQILAAQQARDPIVHLPPQPIPNLSPSKPIEPQYINQEQLVSYRPQVQIGQAPQQPTYKQIPVRPAQYNPPPGAATPQQQYNPQYRANYPQPQPLTQQQYQQSQQATQANYQYSKNLPQQLQQLLQVQQNLPNAIPQVQHQG